MTVETVTYIDDFNTSLPNGATDPKSEGDDHIRNIKKGIKNTFPNVSGAVTATHTELNQGLAPAGALMPYAGASAPTGWLLCYGQAVSRTTYAALFTAIGSAFGTGDGSTTFNLPDMRGRIPVGLDDLGGTSADRVTGAWADGLGGTDGAETHTLSVGEMPSHNHGGGAHTHTFTANTSGLDGSSKVDIADGSGTNVTVTTSSSGTIISAEGGGAAHNNMQPSIALTYIIKT